LDYPIHGSGGWGRVFGVYYLRVGPKGLSKKKKKKKNSHAMVTTFLPDNHGWGYIVVVGSIDPTIPLK
jgi:hypothetical protein